MKQFLVLIPLLIVFAGCFEAESEGTLEGNVTGSCINSDFRYSQMKNLLEVNNLKTTLDGDDCTFVFQFFPADASYDTRQNGTRTCDTNATDFTYEVNASGYLKITTPASLESNITALCSSDTRYYLYTDKQRANKIMDAISK